MNFVDHNLKIEPINYSFSSIYRLDQMHGPDDNPVVSTIFVTDDNVKELVQTWLMNSGYERQRDWLLAKLKDLDAVEGRQQQ